jgi:hypothetical protein
MQTLVSDYLKTLGVTNITFKADTLIPNYAHSGRTAQIIARGQKIGNV